VDNVHVFLSLSFGSKASQKTIEELKALIAKAENIKKKEGSRPDDMVD
jgi:hypothetical protein